MYGSQQYYNTLSSSNREFYDHPQLSYKDFPIRNDNRSSEYNRRSPSQFFSSHNYERNMPRSDQYYPRSSVFDSDYTHSSPLHREDHSPFNYDKNWYSNYPTVLNNPNYQFNSVSNQSYNNHPEYSASCYPSVNIPYSHPINYPSSYQSSFSSINDPLIIPSQRSFMESPRRCISSSFQYEDCYTSSSSPTSCLDNYSYIPRTLPKQSTQKLSSLSSSPTIPHIDNSLLKYPFYYSLWCHQSFIGSRTVLYQSILDSFHEDNQSSFIDICIKKAIHMKKHCLLQSARIIFLSVAIENPLVEQIWIEFSRMEMECGNYQNAEFILSVALSIHPNHLTLIAKYGKVEEKLQHSETLQQLVQIVQNIKTQRSCRVLVDLLSSLVRIGKESLIQEPLSFLLSSPFLSAGWLFHEVLKLLLNLQSIEQTLILIKRVLVRYPKHGPLWRLCLEIVEYYHMYTWNESSTILCYIQNSILDQLVQWSHHSFLRDILWKIYLVRIQYHQRIIQFLRYMFERSAISTLDYHSLYKQQWLQLVANTISCLQATPISQKWRVYITLGCIANMNGMKLTSKKFFQHSLSLCPSKLCDSCLLEYGKVQYFCQEFNNGYSILSYSSYQFLSEWKFILEIINCLLFQNKTYEAYLVCKEAVHTFIGAGRLWAMYIHLIHELFGPEAAMNTFRQALHHVAKSGEVWCEGARIFLNPTSSSFNIKNARIALNYAVFFTPQYGDSYIESLRLIMISSSTFLQFHNCDNPILLTLLLSSIPQLSDFIIHSVYSDPNSGPLWSRCKPTILSPAREILANSVYLLASAIAMNADLYYEALYQSAVKHSKSVKNDNQCNQMCLQSNHTCKTTRCFFAYGCNTDYSYVKLFSSICISNKQQTLYGLNPVDN